MASLWDKIAQDVQAGVLTLSEKTGEWLKIGAEALRGGMETASAKATYTSKMAKLKWEQNLLQREIEKAFTGLGGQTYDLFIADRLSELPEVARDKFEQLRKLEADLDAKEIELENLPKTFAASSDRSSAMDWQGDLERSGGTVTQISITAQTPAAHRKLSELNLSADIVVGAILRGEEMLIATADTTILPGDRVTLLGKKEAVAQAAQLMTTGI